MLLQLLQNLISLYNEGQDSTDAWQHRIDVWVGGLLETGDSPGELFSAVIRDQFTRIRNADRFWFENLANGCVMRALTLRMRDWAAV